MFLINSYRFSATSPTTSTMLLHMNGTDGSTTFTDEKGATFTASGNAQIDTAISKFGGASGLFDGAGDYISTGAAGNYNYLHNGLEDYSIDFWVYPQTTAATTVILDTGGMASANRGIGIWMSAGNTINVDVAKGTSGTYSLRLSSTTTAPDTTWTHCKVCYKSSTNTMYLFVAGNLEASGSLTTPSSSNHSSVFTIGRYVTGNSLFWKGNIDEFRIVRGTCENTSSFTPPSSEYTN